MADSRPAYTDDVGPVAYNAGVGYSNSVGPVVVYYETTDTWANLMREAMIVRVEGDRVGHVAVSGISTSNQGSLY